MTLGPATLIALAAAALSTLAWWIARRVAPRGAAGVVVFVPVRPRPGPGAAGRAACAVAMSYTPDPGNLRVHPERNKALIRQSLQEVGPFRSIAIDGDGVVRAGNGVYEQAQALGLRIREIEAAPDELIAVKRSDLVGDAAKRAAFFDNASGDTSYFDAALLAAAVAAEPRTLGGVLTDEELGAIIGQQQQPVDIGGAGDEGEAPDLDAPTEVQPGDVWQIGRHTIACLDSTNPDNLDRALAGRKPQMLVADPPYGIALETDNTARSNHGSTLTGRARGHNKHAPILGDDRPFSRCSVPIEASEEFWFGADYYIDTIPCNGKGGSWLVWDKRQEGALDEKWGSAFELCWSKQKHKREIIRIVWEGVLGHNRADDGTEKAHPSQKPVKLMTWLIERYSGAGDLILDPFLGSGPSLKAAERSGRAVVGFELSPHYCDHILGWARAAGLSVTRRD